MKVVPDYFAWDIYRQEQYCTDTPEEDIFKIEQFLLQDMFEISVSTEDELEDAWDSMNDEQLLRINVALLPIKGIGEDFFYLNETFADTKNILSYDTLFDYDYEDFEFQEEWCVKAQKDYKKKSYRGSLYFNWARLIIDG